MNGKLCVPDRLASTIVNWWHKWETYHSHGAKLWKSIKHRLFGARLYTHCMKVASSCAQCAVAVPATAKPKGYMRPHPVPVRMCTFWRGAWCFLSHGTLRRWSSCEMCSNLWRRNWIFVNHDGFCPVLFNYTVWLAQAVSK